MSSTDRDDPVDPEALDWARRVQDPDFADWDAHCVWLEADPRNPGRFDTACLLIEDAITGLAAIPVASARPAPMRAVARPGLDPANDNGMEPAAKPKRRRFAWAGGGAIAAALVAAVTLAPMGSGSPAMLVQTAPGEHRTLTLTDGTRIALNGDTAIRYDRADSRRVSLERGQAFFTVVHDMARPFTVQAGDATFRDVGTAFDLVRGERRTAVAVREGAVDYDPEGEPVRVTAGQALDVRGDRAVLRTLDPGQAGGWRHGRLAYREAPLEEVAQEIARTIGTPVSVDPRLAAARFTGVIAVDGDRSRMFRRFAAVAGVSAKAEGRGWRLTPPTQ